MTNPGGISIDRILAEKRWLDNHPQFEQRPATIREFVGQDYLNIEKKIRPGIMDALIEIFGDQVDPNWISVKRKAVMTGAIGVGKTTFASIALPYMVHWVYCLRDPQDYFNLIAGSRIAFMMMSTSEKQAKQVLFGDVKARIDESQWFKKYCKRDPKFENQIRFLSKDLWILPGGSEETTFEGYNILGGIIDEGDSHKKTARKDYAEEGYDCVDEDTEILTKNGWKYHWDLSEADEVLTLNHDTGMSEWNHVEEVRRFDVESEELVRLEGKEFSALTTKNHRWPVTHAKTGERSWTITSELYRHDKIQVAAPHADLPTEPKYDDAFVETVAWGYTEGGIALDMDWKTVHRLTIYQKTSSANCARMRDAFTKVFGPEKESLRSGSVNGLPGWKEVKRTDRDLSNFVFNKAASQILVDHFPNKVPTNEFIMSLTKSQLELFIQVSLLADNCGQNKLAQKNHAAAEAFALACILAGSCVSIRMHHDRANEKYAMMLSRRLKKTHVNPYLLDQNKVNAFSITKENYTGTVWCPRTKNKSWFAMRNGSVYYTGNTINSRIESRFMDDAAGKHRGILIVIGQTKSATGFMRRMYDEFSKDPDGAAISMTIWESKGWHLYTENPDDAKNMRETAPRKSFVYDIIRKEIIPKGDAISKGIDFTSKGTNFIEVPLAYLSGFVRNPVKALRDLAGIPPESADPFISLTHRITSCEDLWAARMGNKSPVTDSSHAPQFEQWFRARDRIKRVLHVDMAYSAEGDALGMAMGHVPEIVDVDGEEKPLIVFDFLMRWHAASGTEIVLSEVRRIIYRLKFELGFNLTRVTLDGFQGVDFRQQLAKNKIPWETLSVDKKKMPYEDLRDAIYDERCLFPKYMTKLNRGDASTVNIAFRELSQLQDVGQKIDHPPNGSKDVADAMAGVVHYLMNDSQYRRGAVRRSHKLEDMPEIPGTPSEPVNLEDFLAASATKSLVSLDVKSDPTRSFLDIPMTEQDILSVDWESKSQWLPDIPW